MQLSDMKRTTGMIIPAWHPASMRPCEIERVLAPCLADMSLFMRSKHTLLVADGAPATTRAARNIRRRRGGFEILSLKRNVGKGGAVAAGIQRLLENSAIRYIVIRDHDNDHLANDAPNLVRLAAHITHVEGHDRVVTIGRRFNVHRSLGFIRGEFETMMNDVIMDAVTYALSRSGRTLNTQYGAAYDRVPDLQSGFKCYTRATAELLVRTLAEAGRTTPDLDLSRHGAEVPPLVETMLAGGVVGEISRLTEERPPMTTYDRAGRFEVKGTVLAWSLQRTGVHLPAARQMLQNAIARRVMAKDRRGLADLLTLANGVLTKLGKYRGEKAAPIRQIHLADYF